MIPNQLVKILRRTAMLVGSMQVYIENKYCTEKNWLI